MKPFVCLMLVAGWLSVGTLLSQPKPTVVTYQSVRQRLNTMPLFAPIAPPVSVARIDWTSILDADKTVQSPTFLVQACITSGKPIGRTALYVNEVLQPAARDLKVERDTVCAYPFRQSVQLREGDNRLRLMAYPTGGDMLTASLTVRYVKPPVVTLDKRLALVIGNADYPGTNKLSNSVNDATDMAVALRKLGFDVLEFTNLDKRGMMRAINTFGEKLRDYQVGLFYYAGHGVQYDNYNYLVPLDAKPDNRDDIQFDCLLADRILAKMDEARTRTNIIVLDACRNDPFERGRGTGNGGLASMNAPIGSVIAYATAPGKTAADGNGRNGLYTAALLKALQTPGLTITQLFQQVRSEVVRQTNYRQVPWETTSLTGDFYFQKK